VDEGGHLCVSHRGITKFFFIFYYFFAIQLNEGPCVEMHGDLSLSAFEAALNELVQRHEVFRYSFRHGSSGVQVFLTDVDKVPFKILEVSILYMFL
jgi:hypothetical protein